MRNPIAFLNRRFLGASLVAAACMAATGLAYADDYSHVSRLLRAGQLNEANAKVEQLLSAKPSDPQIRFFKGVIQSEQGKTQDAINTFTKLTQDFLALVFVNLHEGLSQGRDFTRLPWLIVLAAGLGHGSR